MRLCRKLGIAVNPIFATIRQEHVFCHIKSKRSHLWNSDDARPQLAISQPLNHVELASSADKQDVDLGPIAVSP